VVETRRPLMSGHAILSSVVKGPPLASNRS
jgi:hypothetical protein